MDNRQNLRLKALEIMVQEVKMPGPGFDLDGYLKHVDKIRAYLQDGIIEAANNTDEGTSARSKD